MGKSTKNKVWEQLVRIADANPALSWACCNDLMTYDRRTIEEGRTGERWIWCLREHGSHLFPMDGTHDKHSITYYVDGEGANEKSKFYYVVLIGSENGFVDEIPKQVAKQLAQEYGKVGAITASLS